jgi:hypothetical protein
MTHYYADKGFSKPGVTSIISDTHDKSNALLFWATRLVAQWIRENCPKEIVFDDMTKNDFYRVDEEDLTSAAKNFREVSKTALDIGSETHSAIEEWLKFNREPHNPRPEVLAAFVAFLEFWDLHKMEAISVEKSVYGDYWGGTLDFYGWFDGKLYVIDWKSSKNHYPNEHGPQIAAYRSEIKKPCDGCGVLRLDKITGLPDWKDYSKRYEKDLEHFRLMVPLYLHRHPKIAKGAGWIGYSFNQPF